MMELYHGSYIAIVTPQIIVGTFTKDFGEGFYCTKLKHQAIKWANKYDSPIVSVYGCTIDDSLSVKDFPQMSDEWLDFIRDCRAGIPHHYDIVMGPMADDQIYNYVSDFVNGIITREQFWAMARFKYPTHQVCFSSEKALQCLTYKTAEQCPL